MLPIIPTTRPPISGSSRSPLPRAFAPCTSWKYCGIAKKMPNIANETSVASVVPQVKPADRNSRSSISGRTRRPAVCRAASSRRSQATKMASIATPAAMVASGAVSVQPSWPASMKP